MKKGLNYKKYLIGSSFFEDHLKKHNVYGLAHITLQYWIEKYGIEKVKKLLNAFIESPSDIKKLVELTIKPIAEPNKELHKRLNSMDFSKYR